MWKFAFAATAFVSSVSSSPVAAQSLELGPSLGWYQPLSTFRVGPVESTDLPQSPRELRGFAWGVDGRLLLQKRAGVEGIFATAASTVPGCECPGGFALPPTGERVSLVAVQGLYRIPIGEANEIGFGLGPTMVQHGGEGYGRYGSPKSWGGIGGVELSQLLGSHLEAAAHALAAAYSFHLGYPPQSGPQLDLLIFLDVRWRWRAASPNDR